MSTNDAPRPPRVARSLLHAALPSDVRDDVAGDVEEVFARRWRERGPIRARAWFWRQTLSLSTRFAVERVRDALLPSGSASIALDLKLGLRMLVKYPMLTLIGGIAITIATALGVGASEFVRDMIAPSLPLDEGDRIVRILYNDAEDGGSAAPTLYEFAVWRGSLASVEDLGAYTTFEQGLVSDRGEAGTVSVARVTASAFRTTRVPPMLGRFLDDTDEGPDEPPVVVLGHGPWRTLLGGDPDPIGRIVQLGGTPTTVVGIMPEGYGFPQVQDAWIPVRMDAADQQPATASRVNVFGRLVPGATLESARSELDVAVQRAASDHPEVYEQLTPRVSRFASRTSNGVVALALSGVGVLFGFLLVVACANVATLVFARTVTREGEITVRTALGATRRRIVAQLFAEAIVLVGGATVLGMALARAATGEISRLFFVIQQAPQRPFWWDDGLSSSTVLYAGALALVGAVMIGVVPALKATSGEVQPRLGQLSTGGRGNLRFGGIWTVVIVLQVALSVAFLPLAVSQASLAFVDHESSGFPAEEYLTAQLGRDPTVPLRTLEERTAFLEESARLFEEAGAAIASDPGVEAVALASGLSAMNHIQSTYELVGEGSAASASTRARVLLVDPSYLDLMGATTVAGRSLAPADFTAESRSVVVNEAFVDAWLDGRNVVGAQLRVEEQDPGSEASIVDLFDGGTFVEIAGVVSNPGIDAFGPGAHPVIYAPLDLAPATPRDVGLVGMPQPPAAQLFVRMRPDAGPITSRLYAHLAGVDPTLRLSDVATAANAWRPVHLGQRISGWIFMAVAGIVLMLSVAGIYALMSFTVSRRAREIAIRTAVGGGRRQIAGLVFRRAVAQLTVGVVLGSLIAVPVLRDGVADEGPWTLVVVSSVLLAAGIAACLVPVRRVFAIEPALAMRSE